MINYRLLFSVSLCVGILTIIGLIRLDSGFYSKDVFEHLETSLSYNLDHHNKLYIRNELQ